MTTTIMSSPVLHPPNSGHCSRNPSPTASPSLRPLASSMAKSPSPAPLPAPRALPSYSAPIQPASGSQLTPPASPLMGSSRSFARAPPVRPYASPLLSRGLSGPRGNKPITGDTKEFAEQVVKIFRQRSIDSRRGRHESQDRDGRKVRSLGGSASENWEGEKAELLVDIPVWSPGSFQDLSTLHALRDTTLTHTHALLAYLQSAHSLPASYRLLARSAAPSSVPGSPRTSASSRPASPAPPALSVGWGCIRLCPGIASPILPKKELKPHVRRSSLVMSNSRSRSRSRSFHRNHSPKVSLDRCLDIPEFRLDLDSAIADEPEEDESRVELREGYRSGGSKAGSAYGSDDESEEQSADSIIAKEVERRKVKEGSAFLMTLFGQPALILT